MPIVKANFDDVSNEFVPIAAGKIELLVSEAPVEKVSKAGNAMLEFTYKVQTEGPDKGKTMKDWVVLNNLTKLKRIALSAGVVAGPDGLDTDELIGTTVEAIVSHRIVPDKDNPDDPDLAETRANIKGYVIPKG